MTPPGPYLHTHSFRVAMAEVDVSQIHFTAMFRWIDRGFCEYLAELDHPFTRLLEEGPGTPIVDARCRFHQRVMLDDILTLNTWVSGVGNTSFRGRHHFLRNGELAVEGEMVHVCVNRETRDPVPVPEWLRAAAFDADVIPYTQ